MKKNVELKILVILLIVMISLISFVGIYKKDKGQMLDCIPEYKFGMKINGSREVVLKVSDETKEVMYDSDGNITEDALDEEGNLKEGYTKETVKINKDEILTEENFRNTKKIMEKRLKALGVDEYEVRLNNEVGTITVELPEDDNTDDVISNIAYMGKFEIVDSQTKEVLLDNSFVKEARAVYNTTEAGTTVYLSIEFNKNGKAKLEEITKQYNTTTNEEGESTTKQVSINLDDEALLSTHFDEPITTGYLQLSIGTATTDSATIQDYIKQASQVAALITNNKMDIKYNTESNTYISSSINERLVQILTIVTAIIVIVALGYLCIKYKTNGIFAGISHIGFLTLVLLIIRYVNVVITIEGIAGIIIMLVLNYIIINYMLNKLKNSDIDKDQIIKETYIHYSWILLPMLIISAVFTFMKWLPIASAGMVMFWALVIILIYNYIVSKTLLEK